MSDPRNGVIVWFDHRTDLSELSLKDIERIFGEYDSIVGCNTRGENEIIIIHSDRTRGNEIVEALDETVVEVRGKQYTLKLKVDVRSLVSRSYGAILLADFPTDEIDRDRAVKALRDLSDDIEPYRIIIDEDSAQLIYTSYEDTVGIREYLSQRRTIYLPKNRNRKRYVKYRIKAYLIAHGEPVESFYNSDSEDEDNEPRENRTYSIIIGNLPVDVTSAEEIENTLASIMLDYPSFYRIELHGDSARIIFGNEWDPEDAVEDINGKSYHFSYPRGRRSETSRSRTFTQVLSAQPE